jgi:hypothetical protein
VAIFEQAPHTAPINSGTALNMTQSLLQILASQQKHKSLVIYQRCRQTFKLINQTCCQSAINSVTLNYISSTIHTGKSSNKAVKLLSSPTIN